MKKNFLLVVCGLLIAIIGVNKVDAAVSTCHYDLCDTGYVIKYNTSTGKIEGSLVQFESYCHVDSSKVSASAFISNGKLVCPELYYAYGAGAGGRGFQLYTENNPKLVDTGYYWMNMTIKYNKDKSKIPNTGSSESSLLVCNYTYSIYYEYHNVTDEFKLSITVDTKKKKINGYSIPGRTVGGSLNYNDVVSASGECLSKDKISVVCDTVDGNKCAVVKEEPKEEPEVPEDNEEEDNQLYGCEVIPDVIKKWIKNILNIVKYIALALVIALGALDFMKAAASGEPDQMKKAGQSFVKRLAAVVILFLVPVLVDLILELINLYGAEGTCLE